jgi:hypothetical protein
MLATTMTTSLVEPPKQIPVSLRLGTMLLDHAVICFIGVFPMVLFELIARPGNPSALGSPFAMIPLFVIYFCKDCIGGRSAAKRILKLAVVDKNSGAAASSLQCVVRNLFVIVWPVEVIVALFNQQQRIGDRVARTKLSYYNPNAASQISILHIAIAILIATGFSYLLMALTDRLLLT